MTRALSDAENAIESADQGIATLKEEIVAQQASIKSVIGMIDLFIKDLDKERTEAQTEEKDSQADYEEMMKLSAEKRTSNSKTFTAKEATKASLEVDLDMHNDDKTKETKATKELGATNEDIASFHAECDWLLKYFDMRKEAQGPVI